MFVKRTTIVISIAAVIIGALALSENIIQFFGSGERIYANTEPGELSDGNKAGKAGDQKVQDSSQSAAGRSTESDVNGTESGGNESTEAQPPVTLSGPSEGKGSGDPATDVQERPQESTGSDQKLPAVIPKAVDNKAKSIAGRNVQAEDYLEIAGIVLGKLSLGEIKFLFDQASDDFWVSSPVEEIERVRNLIFSKLSGDDIQKLRNIGKKYGRSMTILDPDIDAAKAKEKQMAKKGIKQ